MYSSKDFSNNPLISIITPVLNGERYLEECLKSVLNQSYTNIDHIFIDGCSTDKTLEILSSYSEKHPGRIRFISEPDKSIGDGYNKGLKLAKGEIFGLLGADDAYEPDAIITVVKFFKKFIETYFVFGDCHVVNNQGKLLYTYPQRDVELEELINSSNPIPCPSAFFKREVFARIGDIDTTTNSFDLDYWIRIGKVFPLRHIPKVLSRFRVHQNSFSGNKNAYKLFARESFIISRRYGGSLFSQWARSYYFSVVLGWFAPVLGWAYPSIKKTLKIGLVAKSGGKLTA